MLGPGAILLSCVILAKTLDHVPRGVSISKASLYNAVKEFTCLDESITLPYSYVNDDYCDCSDGSDEPGTSACPNGVFHCSNTGHVPLNIPSSRVNDGICDCCDASDEYGIGNCSNNCAVLSAQAKLQAEKMAELMVQGNNLRFQMITAGKQVKVEKQDRISRLQIEKTEAERLKAEAEEIKLAAEASEATALEYYKSIEEAQKIELAEQEKLEAQKEALEAFNHLDSDADNKLQRDELRSRSIIDQNKDGEVSDDELQFIMDSKDEIEWEEFFEKTWPKLKPFYMMDQGLFIPPEKVENEKEPEIRDENEKMENSEIPEAEEEWDRSEEAIEKEDLEEDERPDEIEHSASKYDEQTQKLIDEANKARAQYESAERAVRDLERELSQLRESLAKDYGVDDEFLPLEGQCYSFTDREYTYKLCTFDQVVQMAKNGGSETRLGVWKSWASPGDYSVMLYEKGQSCWNGPQRSTKVLVTCGLETVIVGATEPNKCEYVLEFKTPAACKLSPKVENHDEL